MENHHFLLSMANVQVRKLLNNRSGYAIHWEVFVGQTDAIPSHGFPMVFPWFSHGFPMAFP